VKKKFRAAQAEIERMLSNTAQVEATIGGFLKSISNMSSDLLDTAFNAQGMNSALEVIDTFINQSFLVDNDGQIDHGKTILQQFSPLIAQKKFPMVLDVLTKWDNWLSTVGVGTCADLSGLSLNDLKLAFTQADLQFSGIQLNQVNNILSAINKPPSSNNNMVIRRGIQCGLLDSCSSFLGILNPLTSAALKQELKLSNAAVEYVKEHKMIEYNET